MHNSKTEVRKGEGRGEGTVVCTRERGEGALFLPRGSGEEEEEEEDPMGVEGSEREGGS